MITLPFAHTCGVFTPFDLHLTSIATIKTTVGVGITVEPLNNGHIGSRNLVLCWEVVPILGACFLSVVQSLEVVRISEVEKY